MNIQASAGAAIILLAILLSAFGASAALADTHIFWDRSVMFGITPRGLLVALACNVALVVLIITAS